MPQLAKRTIISIAIFSAFYIAGNFAIYCENWHDNMLASSAIFGVSFVGLLGGGAKIWFDLFG
jgi:hypothetical protein